MIKADLELLMAGTVAGTVDASLISQWVSLDDELAVTLDEGALTAWVDELAAVCNTVGTQRTYTRSDGKVVTVAGGTYGWEVDKDALLALVKDGVANGAANTVDIPCMQTGDAYNGAGSGIGALVTWTSTCPSSMRACTTRRVPLSGNPTSSPASLTASTTRRRASTW